MHIEFDVIGGILRTLHADAEVALGRQRSAIAWLDETRSVAVSGNRLREWLVSCGRLVRQGDHDVLTEDTLFRTLSAASLVLSGAHINGRIEWIDAHGVTLETHQIRSAESTATA